jgi:Na+/H+ antiporter NhaB
MYVVCAALIQGGTLRLRPNIIRILRNILIVRTYIAGIFFFEMLTGIWASFLVDALSRLPILAAVAPKSPGFLSAFLMTLTQGALITLSLVLMAGLVLGIRAMVAGKPEAGRGS